MSPQALRLFSDLVLIGTSYGSIPLSELEILERNAESIQSAIFENYIDGSEIEGCVVVSSGDFTLSGKTILVIGTGAYARVVIAAFDRFSLRSIS